LRLTPKFEAIMIRQGKGIKTLWYDALSGFGISKLQGQFLLFGSLVATFDS
jgi:hypothetical protein